VNLNTADMKDMQSICKLFGASNLQAMMNTLQSKGLGREVKSWVSNGQNQQVTSADIKKAADPAALRAMASEQGMSPDELCGHIAKILPMVVDQATPDGMVPQQGGAMKDSAVNMKAQSMGKGRDAMKKMAKK
jgi:uncharacterized protein YidB (DUF937 family)